MMKKVLIYCEGITDQVFIADCLEFFFEAAISKKEKRSKKKLEIDFELLNIKGKVIEISGCDRLRQNEVLHVEMKDNQEGVNLVIFDADYEGTNNGNKGLKSCKQKLDSIKTTFNIDFDYYLWPNNSNDGEIETLLREFIPLDKEPIFNCIEAHQNCLKSLDIENLKYADLKNQINFYLHTSNQNSALSKRNYKNKDFWSLNRQTNEKLNQFLSFLEKHIN